MLELCKKYEGKVELVTKSADEREFFSNIHFPFCRLGTRKGSVESYKNFIQFLKDNKVIDLIYNRDAFISNKEDCLAAKAHFQRSSTSGAAESCLSSQVFSPTIPTATHENLFESTKEIPLQSNKTSVAAVSKNMPTSPSLTPDLTPASLLVIPSKVNKNLSSYTLAGLNQEGLLNIKSTPPCKSHFPGNNIQNFHFSFKN
jgi:hypothetical protein